MRKRKGFALAMVLIVMVFIIGISAVIMDMTTNYVGSSQSTIDHQKLYNAAQSGIEWGRVKLWENSNDLYVEEQTFDGNLSSISAQHEDGSLIGTSMPIPEGVDSIQVNIYNCDYDPGSYDPSLYDLPPVYNDYVSPGASAEDTFSPVGTSGYIDPNRNILGGDGVSDHVFVIRSKATKESKEIEIELMVVVAYE